MAKFNETTCSQIITYYENGLPLKYASELAGVSRQTVYNWKTKGENARSGKYKKFAEDLKKAKAKFVAYHLNRLNESKDPWTSKYLLEVTDPQTFVVEKKLKTSNDTKVKVDSKSLFEDKESYHKISEELEDLLE